MQSDMIAGAMKYRPAILHISIQVCPVAAASGPMTAYAARGPTRPAVPMPAPIALLVMPKIIVETGPRMAEVRVGASHMIGLRAMFPIWSIDVPIP